MRFHLFYTLLLPGTLLAQQATILNMELDKFQNVRDFCISKDGEEAYFSIQSPNQEISQIACVKKGKWNAPELLPFCDEYSYLEPFLFYNEKRLYFASNRPKNDSSKAKSDYDIWYVERIDRNSPWSKPINLGNKVNTSNDEFYPTLSDNYNLYITIDAKSGLGKDDIYVCIWDGKEYSAPTLLSTAINSEGYEFNAFIAKDESFLIYTKYNAKDGLGSGDLYLAKKDPSGAWASSKNMGNEINTKNMEYCPYYDGNTGTLYFR